MLLWKCSFGNALIKINEQAPTINARPFSQIRSTIACLLKVTLTLI
jgi:hypothetical protein